MCRAEDPPCYNCDECFAENPEIANLVRNIEDFLSTVNHSSSSEIPSSLAQKQPSGSSAISKVALNEVSAEAQLQNERNMSPPFLKTRNEDSQQGLWVQESASRLPHLSSRMPSYHKMAAVANCLLPSTFSAMQIGTRGFRQLNCQKFPATQEKQVKAHSTSDLQTVRSNAVRMTPRRSHKEHSSFAGSSHSDTEIVYKNFAGQTNNCALHWKHSSYKGISDGEDSTDSSSQEGMENIRSELPRSFSTGSKSKKSSRSTGYTSFPVTLYNLLETAEECDYSHIISWQIHGRAFRVHDQMNFVALVMPRFFQQTRFASFQRQLALYGFVRMTRKGLDKGSYWHERFLRGSPQLCHSIARSRVKGAKEQRFSFHRPEPDFYQMPYVLVTNQRATMPSIFPTNSSPILSESTSAVAGEGVVSYEKVPASIDFNRHQSAEKQEAIFQLAAKQPMPSLQPPYPTCSLLNIQAAVSHLGQESIYKAKQVKNDPSYANKLETSFLDDDVEAFAALEGSDDTNWMTHSASDVDFEW